MKRKFPSLPFSFRRVRTVFRQILGVLMLLLALTGFFVATKNPMPWIEPLFPVHITFFWGGWLHLEQAYVQGLLTTLYADALILRSAIGISAFTLLISLVLLVQNPLGALRTLGRGLKRSPKALLYSPITFYRRVVAWRNWLLAKIEYLQAESGKWKATFNIMKSPYSLLRAMGFSPQMAVSFLVAGSAVGGGVVVNETVFSERSFERGDSGTYNAPVDAPISFTEGDNTLRIVLGTTPVREITIENVSVGTIFQGSALPSGQTTAVLVGGVAISNGTSTVLEIGELIIEKSRCKSMDFTNINAHTINVVGNASDGQSINTTAGSSRMLAIGGGHHQADAMVTSGGTYDRIHIDAPTSAVNGKIGKLTLSNLYTKGGACTFTRLEVGTLTIKLNEIGNGDGFSTKEFSIASSVTGANWNVADNVEVSIAEPAAVQ